MWSIRLRDETKRQMFLDVFKAKNHAEPSRKPPILLVSANQCPLKRERRELWVGLSWKKKKEAINNNSDQIRVDVEIAAV